MSRDTLKPFCAKNLSGCERILSFALAGRPVGIFYTENETSGFRSADQSEVCLVAKVGMYDPNAPKLTMSLGLA